MHDPLQRLLHHRSATITPFNASICHEPVLVNHSPLHASTISYHPLAHVCCSDTLQSAYAIFYDISIPLTTNYKDAYRLLPRMFATPVSASPDLDIFLPYSNCGWLRSEIKDHGEVSTMVSRPYPMMLSMHIRMPFVSTLISLRSGLTWAAFMRAATTKSWMPSIPAPVNSTLVTTSSHNISRMCKRLVASYLLRQVLSMCIYCLLRRSPVCLCNILQHICPSQWTRGGWWSCWKFTFMQSRELSQPRQTSCLLYHQFSHLCRLL